ncbi:hypothetical protein J2W17_001474 [Pseudomonas lini]|uniref:hypothetical protein n=1 Tax=Pseudomonas lini TaxID=163011 RepID=UPI0027892F31|nr:hypothetical protein [Pseudomonas lini]MDQ0122529.1 hypothetical protein [Pseudomonas lini]
MTTESPTKRTATGYFNAKGDNFETFNSEKVLVDSAPGNLQIEGSIGRGSLEGRIFLLLIDPSTLPGEQDFIFGGDGKMRYVQYQDKLGTVSALSGKFNAILNNTTKKHRITFNLEFGRIGNIAGEIDVSE